MTSSSAVDAASLNGERIEADNGQHALRLAGGGWPVFPCKPDKKPMTEHGFHDATTDPEQILKWWDEAPGALVGVYLGGVGKTGIDIDRHPDTPNGYETCERQGWIEYVNACEVRRASISGTGEHLIYDGLANSRNDVAPGIDRKSVGGYVVAMYELPPVSEVVQAIPEPWQGYAAPARLSTGASQCADVAEVGAWLADRRAQMSDWSAEFLNARVPDPFAFRQDLWPHLSSRMLAPPEVVSGSAGAAAGVLAGA